MAVDDAEEMPTEAPALAAPTIPAVIPKLNIWNVVQRLDSISVWTARKIVADLVANYAMEVVGKHPLLILETDFVAALERRASGQRTPRAARPRKR